MKAFDRRRPAGPSGRPYVIHNIGEGAREEDRLFEFPITGHYRIPYNGSSVFLSSVATPPDRDPFGMPLTRRLSTESS